VSTYGTNTYGDNAYGGPAVWSEALTGAGSAADTLDATTSYALRGVECVAQVDGSATIDAFMLTGASATAEVLSPAPEAFVGGRSSKCRVLRLSAPDQFDRGVCGR
jgi:hypothetical protein